VATYRVAVLALTLGTICTGLVAASDGDDVSQLLLRAAEQSDIRSLGSTPFELDARLEVFVGGKPNEGTYQMLWFSPDRWREEVNLPGYRRVKGSGEKGGWLARNLDHEVIPVADLDAALEFPFRLRRAASKQPGKLTVREKSGLRLKCSRSEPANFDKEDFCFREDGTLHTEIFPYGKTASAYVAAQEYSDFSPFAGKLFPRSLRVLGDKDVLLNLSVERLAPLGQMAESTFTPPEGARPWATCQNPEPAKLLHQVHPSYPTIERTAHKSGRVILYALIQTDGSVTNLKVEGSSSQNFDAAAIEAVRQWKYQPTSCDGMPVPTETFINVLFATAP
jgi:TonB family protein